MRKARLNLNRSREVIARERQTEESQYYEEQEECLYVSRIAD